MRRTVRCADGIAGTRGRGRSVARSWTRDDSDEFVAALASDDVCLRCLAATATAPFLKPWADFGRWA